jgi:DNA-binding transcriptional MerR regulator
VKILSPASQLLAMENSMRERSAKRKYDDNLPEYNSVTKRDRSTYQSAGAAIGDLARDFGVTLRTLRFYEARGLLSPVRDGMQRIYCANDRARLALILKGKQLGFTLTEIRAMLAEAESPGLSANRDKSDVGGLHMTQQQIAEQLELLRNQQSEVASAIAELEAIIQRAPAAQ